MEDASSVEALLYRARLHREGGQFDLALADLVELERRQPELRPVFFVRAQVHGDRMDWLAAETAWQGWSQMGEGTVPGWKLRADLLAATDRPRLALDALDEAAALGAGPDTALRRARLAVQLGQVERGVAALQADAERLGAAVLRLELYELELGRGRASAAVAQVTQLLGTMPDHPDWLVLRARALLASGDVDAARADFERAAQLLDVQIVLRPTSQRIASRESVADALEALP